VDADRVRERGETVQDFRWSRANGVDDFAFAMLEFGK
jgi:hypothetical protein